MIINVFTKYFIFLACTSFSFLHLKGQQDELQTIIPLGTKATIIIDAKDSINFKCRIVSIETFTKTINVNSQESELFSKDPKTDCVELVFCNGNYGNSDQKTFLFIKSWYTFSIKYNAGILRSNQTDFENTSVLPLYPKVLSREDWPYKIEQIKLSGFEKISFQDNETREIQRKLSGIKYMGTEKADRSFASLFSLINSKIGNLTLLEIDSIEQRIDSKDITPSHYIELGKSIYPNKKDFKLETPKTYERIEDSTFTNQVEYYYTKKDGSIKAILFEWNKTRDNSGDLFSFSDNSKDKANEFQDKFRKIEDLITTQIGKYSKKKIESQKHKDSFRDDVIWKSRNGLVVYMFMFGNESQHYRQIRVAIYKE